MKKYLTDGYGNLFGSTECKKNVTGLVDYGEDQGTYFLKKGSAYLTPRSRISVRFRENLHFLPQYDIRP
jgi:hypothetical protein